jgi:hypothetical protein
MNNLEDKNVEPIKLGLIWVPWTSVVVATQINGEIVWYKNKWKNLLLKIKFLFIKPTYQRHLKKSRYEIKPINHNLYGKVNIKSINE